MADEPKRAESKRTKHRETADLIERQAEELATLREQLAERDAEIAALKAHAEALAGQVKAFSERTAYYHEDDSMGYLVCCSGRFGHDPNCEAINALNSYRTAYPKED